jgi:hypothetical protein
MTLQDEINPKWKGHQRTLDDHSITNQNLFLWTIHLKSHALDSKSKKSLM